MNSTLSGFDLHEHLARWVAEGLIDSAQASRIEAVEQARLTSDERPAGPAGGRPTGVPPPRGGLGGRAPLIVEALGYLGGTLAIIAGFIAASQLWPDIPVAAQLSFAGTAAVVLGLVGAAIHTDGDPAFVRLHGVLWMMSTACVAAFVTVLAEQVWDMAPAASTVLAAAVTTGYAAALWWRTPTPLQLVALFVAAAVTVGSGIAWIDADLQDWASGLGVWALAALWVLGVRRGYLRPRSTGYLIGSIGLLIGAILTMEVAAGEILALCTVLTLLTAGVMVRRVWLLGLGAVGALMVVPQTAVRYLPESVGAPLALLAVGLSLLGAAIWLARQWKRPRSGVLPHRSAHDKP